MDVLLHIDLHLVYLLLFSVALSFGVGVSLLGATLALGAIADQKITDGEFHVIKSTKLVGWLSFVLYAFAGIGLFTLSYQAMLGLGIFWASQTIVTILFLNAFLFWFVLLPSLGDLCAPQRKTERPNEMTLAFVAISETVGFVSWLFLLIHHVMYRVPFEFSQFMALYFFVLALTFALITLCFLGGKAQGIVRAVAYAALTALLLAVLATLCSIFIEERESTVSTATDTAIQPAAERSGSEKLPAYTPSEVALHDNVEDCWVVIDAGVYDATDAAAIYPEIYSCGQDVTENYRTVVAEGVSERMQKKQVGVIGFTAAEVAAHDNKDDCWLIIDEYVFDATKESQLHPAAFNCGSDATVNYHKNHGDEISDKMMQYHIGYVDDGTRPEHIETEMVVAPAPEPTRELYVEEGEWEPEELMAIVEKDAEKLLFIDGSTHAQIGRIHDVGYQPHTSVFSPDAQYMYIIARNGWLTKIDLLTLEPVATVKVGENSRGTALTDDGKYLAIGNYEPGNVVILDAETMEILKTIPTTGTLDDDEVESRVGAMVEDGERIIVALKDLNSVWIIDTAQDDFPVVEEYWNIGSNETPLHDAYLTPDGRFYIVASMGSHTVWVLDTDTWEPVGEIETGDTPHTGPGATWQNQTYVPALGEGLITVINTDTWEPMEYIKTGGPGLFVRSFGEDPNYPYVWAETAFGENHDEIYVIDARTNEIIKTLRPVEGESSWHPEFTNDGSYVYVVSQSGNEVTIYDAHTFEVIKRIEADTPSAVSSVGNRVEEFGL